MHYEIMCTRLCIHYAVYVHEIMYTNTHEITHT